LIGTLISNCQDERLQASGIPPIRIDSTQQFDPENRSSGSQARLTKHTHTCSSSNVGHRNKGWVYLAQLQGLVVKVPFKRFLLFTIQSSFAISFQRGASYNDQLISEEFFMCDVIIFWPMFTPSSLPNHFYIWYYDV
jgi:hypothetical protein